jgi:hypothetical protein
VLDTGMPQETNSDQVQVDFCEDNNETEEQIDYKRSQEYWACQPATGN